MDSPFSLLIIRNKSTEEIIRQKCDELDIDFNIDNAGTGKKALSLLKSRNYDLVISPGKIGKLNGPELIEKIKEKNINVPLIIIADEDDEKSLLSALYKGFEFTILPSKDPAYTIERIKEKIIRTLDQKKTDSEVLEDSDRYKAIISGFDGMIYTCSKDYRIEYMNDRLTRRTGHNATGEFCYKVLHDRDSKCPWCVNDRVFAGETVTLETKSPKDNKWYHFINSPVYHKDGSVSKETVIIDITPLKDAKEKIKESNTLMQAILDSATHIGIIALDKHGIITLFNKGAEKLLGYNSEELVGKETPMKFHMESEISKRRKELSKKLGRTIKVPELFLETPKEEKSEKQEWTFKRKDGTLITVEITTSTLYDKSGNENGALGIFSDITAQKNLDEALKLYKLQSSGLIANIPNPTFAIDLNGKVIAWNKAIEYMTGVPASDILGKGDYEYSVLFYGQRRPILIDLVTASEKELKKSEYKDIKRTGKVISFDHKILELKGKKYIVRANASPILDDSGKITGAIESITDITSLKNIEDALRESEEKFRGIAERSSDIILSANKEFQITYSSPSSKKILGYEPEDMIGKGPEEFLLPEDIEKAKKVIGKLKRGGLIEGLEIRLRKKDGTYALLELSGSPIIENNTINGLQMIGRDITEKKSDQEQILKLFNKQKELLGIINRSPAVAFLWKAEENWPVEAVSANISQFGYTVEDFTSGRIIFSSIIHPDDLERVGFEVEYNSTNNVDGFTQIYRILGKDKSIFWIEDFTHIRRNKKGIITHYQGIIIDITERRKTEDALKRKTAVLRGVIESPKDVVIFALDRQYRYGAFNENHRQTMKHIWGADIAIGNSMLDYIKNPKDQKKAKENFDRALSGESFTVIEEYGDSALVRKWYEDIYNPITDENGNIIGLTLFLTDITERKQIEEKLKESEDRFRELFNSIHSGVVVYHAVDDGADFEIVDFNHGAEIIENIKKQDLIGKRVSGVFPGVEEFGLLKVFQRVWQTGKSEHHPLSLYQDDRIVSWRENSVYRLPSGEIVAIYDDVTEAKEAEEAIKLSENRYRQLFDSSPVSIWEEDFSEGKKYLDQLKESGITNFREYFEEHPEEVLHLAGMIKILDVNDATLELMKAKTKDELIIDLPKIFTDKSIKTFREEVIALAEGEVHHKGESGHKTLLGDEIEVITGLTVAPGYEKTFARILLSLIDITERKTAEKEVTKLAAIVQHSGEFISLANTDGQITFINEAGAEMVGIDINNVYGYNVRDIIPDSMKEKFRDELNPSMMKKGSWEGEFQFQNIKTEEIIDVHSMNFSILNPETGAPLYYANVSLDITEIKKANRAVVKEKKTVDYILESLPGMFFIFDSKLQFIRWNKNFETITGHSGDEILKINTLDNIADKDKERVSNAIKNAFSEGYDEVEADIITKDGKEIPFIFSAYRKIIDNSPYILGMGLNITKAKEAEKEIAKLALIVQHSGEFIALADKDGKATFINEAGAKMIGVNQNEISNYHIHDFLSDDEKNKVSSEVFPAIAKKGLWEGDLQYVNLKTGVPVDVHTMSFSIKDPETNAPLYFVNISLDITARKRAEEALAREKANVEYILDSLPGMFYMFYMIDQNGRFVRWNKNLETLTGYSAEEVLKMKPLEFIDEKYKETISSSINKAFTDGYADVEAGIVTKDGKKIPFFFSANRKIIDDTPYILGMGLDITKTKDAQKEIAKLAAIVQHSGEFISLANTDGQITFINEAGAKMIGMDKNNISLYKIQDILPNDQQDKLNSEILPTLKEKGFWKGDLRYQNLKTGELTDVHAMTFTIKDPDTDKTMYLANVSLNITDRKNAEAALKEVNKKLNLLGSITRHDILNQVTVAQGYMEILEMDGILQKDSKTEKYSENILGAIETIKRQILFTKDYKDLGEQSPEWYNVGEIIEKNYLNISFHNIKLVNETDNLEIYADPLFEKVIYNLFDNAVKHGDTITTIKFYFKESEEQMKLICEDDGTGIPKEYKEKIFKREYYKHTGLGLFLSREILSITGLSIEETGEFGKGAKFVIHIPKGMFRIGEL